MIDAPRSGRPQITTEKQAKVIDLIKKDRHGREKSTFVIAAELDISQRSVVRILRKHGYKKVKPTWKPNLTPAMKEGRLAFAIKYEDWKRVVWTDGTSVVLGQGRGNNRI